MRDSPMCFRCGCHIINKMSIFTDMGSICEPCIEEIVKSIYSRWDTVLRDSFSIGERVVFRSFSKLQEVEIVAIDENQDDRAMPIEIEFEDGQTLIVNPGQLLKKS